MTDCSNFVQNASLGTNGTVPFVVESTGVYTAYQACFISIYFLLAGYCLYTTLLQVVDMGSVRNSFRHQVIFTIGIGAFVRGLFFFDLTEFAKWIFAGIATVCWMLAFCLIVFFWLEMQMYTKTMKNVERLKTPMFVYVVVFSVVAIANAIVQAAYRNGCKQSKTLNTVKNLTSILQQMLMAVVVVLFGYAAVNLLSRLRMMIPKNAEGLTVKRKLSKLTFFIFAEVAVAIIMSVTWMTRSVFLPKLEDDSPYAYFGLKVLEKFFEFLGLFLLSMTIGAKAQPKKQMPKFTTEKTDRVRRGMSVAKRPEGVKKTFGAPKTRRSKSNFGIVHEESFIFDKDKGNTGEGQRAPAFEEGEASAAGHEGNLNPDLDYWVEMVSEEGDMFYYHTETNVTQWEVPEGPDVVILSMDDLKKVIDPKGGGGELAISNRV